VFKTHRFTKIKYFSLVAIILTSLNLHAAEPDAVPEADIEKLTQELLTGKVNVREEALTRLRWAGISDERVFDPIAEKLQSNKKINKKYAKIYIDALTYSGNAKYLQFLEDLSEDKSHKGFIQNMAKKAMLEFDHYKSISQLMNDGKSTSSPEEFWANRYTKGLRVTDRVRMRWAARDLYLSGLNTESYDVAKTFLSENYKNASDDSYLIDSMAFLCKSLGLSRNTKYKDILIEIANNTPNKKLAKYAERSVQYFDRNFESSNPLL
jgi:hypothetical protein